MKCMLSGMYGTIWTERDSPGDTGMERSRNVFRRAVYTLHVLQQAMPRFRDRPGGRPT